MHQFVSSGGNIVAITRNSASNSGGGPTGGPDSPPGSGGTMLITTGGGVTTVNEAGEETEGVSMTSLGSHFLTTADPRDIDTNMTKIEVESVGMEVVTTAEDIKLKKEPMGTDGEKKVCLWPTGNGLSCGKTFTKFDSLKRHLAEAHKGVRPYACTLCGKSYGRRDYLQRHLKSHNANYAVNLSGSSANTTGGGTLVTQQGSPLQNVKVQVSSKPNILVQVQQPTVQQQPPQQIVVAGGGNQQQQLPLFNVQLTGAPVTKTGGSKICRWVQNDGTVCGKAFSKLDSLRRHVTELHKGVRPYACNLCDKNYGRRDYLERHMRTHDANNKRKNISGGTTVTTAGGTTIDWGPNSGVHVLPGSVITEDGNVIATVPGSGGTGNATVVTSTPVPTTPRIPKKKRKDIPAEEKKICLWVLEDGTACGKTFTKFDSLKRHVSEAHKGIRPYACTLCGKNYGRRDYLLRHLKSHNNDADASALTSPTRSVNSTTQLVSQVVNHNGTVNFTSPTNSGPPAAVMQAISSQPIIRTVTTQAPASVLASVQQQTSSHAPAAVLASLPTVTTQTVRTATPPVLGNITTVSSKKQRADDKKTCRWVLDNGTVCGRSFSKFDSLRRHVQELHKGIRPFVCSLCDKSYGRRDYLQRHMKSHDAPTGTSGGATTTTVVVTQ